MVKGAIAKNSNDYFAYLSMPPTRRPRTSACLSNALGALGDYKYYGKLTKSEYLEIKKQIESAPHDDAISVIMGNLRRKVYG